MRATLTYSSGPRQIPTAGPARPRRDGIPFRVTLLVLSLAAGCAYHTPKPLPTLAADAMPLSRTEGAFRIRIDPYFDVERQKGVFDEDLSSEDVLAVRVHLQNTGAGRITLQPADMAIEFPDGRTVPPTNAAAVASKVTGGTAGVIGSGIVFGSLGFAAAWGAREHAKSERIKDYAAKELQAVSLKPDESIHGFVYFIGPPRLIFREGTLAIPYVDTEGAAAKVVRLSLAEAHRTP